MVECVRRARVSGMRDDDDIVCVIVCVIVNVLRK
jgi:hypothetical protein